VTGVTGGYQRPGAKAVIPAKASAKLDIRLVPDQQPEEIADLLRAHLAEVGPAGLRVGMRILLSARPVTMRRDHPAVGAAMRAYRSTFGVAPVFVRSGGSIPVVGLIQDILGLPVVMMGFGLSDDHIHGPNERLHLPTFFRGIETSKRFLYEAAGLKGAVVRARPSRAPVIVEALA
jgi:acetylornithine deacetylase/succinyl-diaminopimelate desuccinylase-like protein